MRRICLLAFVLSCACGARTHLDEPFDGDADLVVDSAVPGDSVLPTDLGVADTNGFDAAPAVRTVLCGTPRQSITCTGDENCCMADNDTSAPRCTTAPRRSCSLTWVECSGTASCPTGMRCCSNGTPGLSSFYVTCAAECAGRAGSIRVCETAAECGPGQICAEPPRSYTIYKVCRRP